MNSTYYEALSFCQTSTRENGIDYALTHNGTKLSALLVPPDVGQTYQIAAQAGTAPRISRIPHLNHHPAHNIHTHTSTNPSLLAGYPMLTLPASTNATTGMPFGLALMGTAWSEAELVKWGSAIEDLGFESGGRWGRTRPMWGSYRERNLPVLNL